MLLQIWDTAGQERFSALSTAFFRGADAAIFVFDATQPDSLISLRRWWNEFTIRCPVPEGTEADFCAIFVGNKLDLQKPLPHPIQTNGNGYTNGGAKAITEQSARRFLDELIPLPRTPSPTAESSTRRRTIYMDGDSLVSAAASDDNVTTPTQPANIPLVPHSRPDEIEPESPPRTPIGVPSQSNGSPRIPWGAPSRSKSRGRGAGREGGGGTATTTHTIYHTPAASIFRTATNSPARGESQSMLRRGGSSMMSMQTARSNFSVTSPTPVPTPTPKRPPRASVTSATSDFTIKPNKSLDSVPPNPSTDALTARTQASITLPDTGPRLFWTSARTGDGVAPVFEYIARRVVQRWEWEESRMNYEDGGVGGWDGEEQGPTALRLRGDWGRGRKGWKAACC